MVVLVSNYIHLYTMTPLYLCHPLVGWTIRYISRYVQPSTRKNNAMVTYWDLLKCDMLESMGIWLQELCQGKIGVVDICRCLKYGKERTDHSIGFFHGHIVGSISNRFSKPQQSPAASETMLMAVNHQLHQCSDLRACMCGPESECRRISTCIAWQCGGVRKCCWASAQSSRIQSSWSPSLLMRKQLHQWPSPRIGNVMSSLKLRALAARWWLPYASRNETGNSSVSVAVVSWRQTKFKAALTTLVCW